MIQLCVQYSDIIACIALLWMHACRDLDAFGCVHERCAILCIDRTEVHARMSDVDVCNAISGAVTMQYWGTCIKDAHACVNRMQV